MQNWNKVTIVKRFLIISFLALFLLAGTVAAFAAEPEVRRIGDVDLNGTVNVKDATLIQKFAASIQTLSEEALKAADTDASGKVNVKDATLIQKFVAGLTEDFPADTKPEATSGEQTTAEPQESTTQDPTQKPTVVPTEDPTENPTENTTEFVPETKPQMPVETTGPVEATDPTEPETSPTEKPEKPSVDSDGYFDVVIRP